MKGPAELQARAAPQSKLDVARVMRTKYGYIDLALALLHVAARDDPQAKLELGLAFAEGDWGVVQDMATAFRWMTDAAHAGIAHAMADLAVCYNGGIGCERDEAQSLLWAKKAATSGDDFAGVMVTGMAQDEKQDAAMFSTALTVAQTGDRHAQYLVACSYKCAQGVSRNMGKAVEWFTKAAEQNLSKAQFDLAVELEEGIGVGRDLARAFYWYERAAIQGFARAMLRVRSGGSSAWRDEAKGAEWVWRAARAGYPSAQKELDKLPQKWRDHCVIEWHAHCLKAAVWWERNHLAFDTAETIKWLEIGEECEDKWSLYRLGRCYCMGEFVVRDDRRAYDLILRSAELEYPPAQLAMVYLLLRSRGVKRDDELLLKWSQKAFLNHAKGAECGLAWSLYTAPEASANAKAAGWFGGAAKAGDLEGLCAWAYCYAYGQGGVARDVGEAARLFAEGEIKGFAPALVGLGVLLKRGLGVKKDEAEAAKRFAKAANEDGFFQLAVCHMKGQGVAVDAVERVRLFGCAMAKGHDFARRCVVACAAAGLGMFKNEEYALVVHRELEGEKGTLAEVRAMGRDPMRVISECEVFASVSPLVEFKIMPA
jgi:TPR repeat protein